MLVCRILPRFCSPLPISSSLASVARTDWHQFSTTSRRNESKKPDIDLEKELERLNEDLKKDFDSKIKDSEETIDKTFMNFKAQAERDAYQRSGKMFSWKVAAVTLGVGASCLAALFYIRKIRIEEREKHIKYLAGKARIGGDWELVNTEGKLEGSEQLKGNWLLLYFGFTHCPDICPDEIEKMIKVVDILDARPGKDKIPIKPIFISVDPERDTIKRVKEYCAEFSPKLQGYTGSLEQVNKVAKTFRVYHSQGPRTGKNKDDYIVDHTVITYLIDPDGLFHDYYGQTRTAEDIASIIEMKVLKYNAKNLTVFWSSLAIYACAVVATVSALAVELVGDPGGLDMATQQLPKSEFVVRVPKRNENKRYSVLKFNGMDRVDTSKWTVDSMVHMEREDNKNVTLSTQTVQEYGEGSEYGKAAREEARRKKYGRQARSYKLDNQPWHLSFVESDGRTRKMRSIREGGAGEHADYWVFLKSGEEFLAYKVDDWHKFLPAITHKTLDIDQAEEKFLERNKVMNQFALKAQILSQLKTGEEDGEQLEKPTRSLKIKDGYSSSDSDGEDDDRNDEDGAPKKKEGAAKKKKNHEKPKKDKRQRVENGDEVAKYESSDGEDEGREYDYMSDSGSDSE
ncbi:hypothetical protein GCK32_007436 [Trichostrongylus colubriformis]|uniref:Transcription initiation factor IIF subunit alpha n=1 Tax=Trichostrongylus colubriformis TaxID=6319 RepID=A0AAN8F8B4_TRICO